MIKYEFLLERYEQEDGLRKAVLKYLIDRYHDYNDIEDCIGEILTHGCSSGCVSSLIYYRDTLEFYNQFKEEINELLYDVMHNVGMFAIKEFLNNWDITDPLALDTNNQNILAWFGFEETLYRFALEWKVDF